MSAPNVDKKPSGLDLASVCDSALAAFDNRPLWTCSCSRSTVSGAPSLDGAFVCGYTLLHCGQATVFFSASSETFVSVVRVVDSGRELCLFEF